MTVSFHPTAELELKEAAFFYEAAAHGLGQAFIAEVERALDQIAAYPTSSPAIQGVVRKKTLLRFPYSILYSTDAAIVRVLAIANQRRRPFYWTGRQ
ncbi:MAG: type II toxin-antitoxin system RelE/ParE family toxin [Bacteroidota bacterium]